MMEISNTGWLTLSSGRRACVGKPAKRRHRDARQGFFVLGANRPHQTTRGGRAELAPIEAHGFVVLGPHAAQCGGSVQLRQGVLSIGEAAELERAAAELARRSGELLREALR